MTHIPIMLCKATKAKGMYAQTLDFNGIHRLLQWICNIILMADYLDWH